MRGGRKQTGGFLDGIFGTPTTSDQSVSDQPVSSKPWWKFWEPSTTNNTPTNETANPVVQEISPIQTEEELSDSKIYPKVMNGGRRKIRRQRRTKKRSKSKSKSKAKTT